MCAYMYDIGAHQYILCMYPCILNIECTYMLITIVYSQLAIEYIIMCVR